MKIQRKLEIHDAIIKAIDKGEPLFTPGWRKKYDISTDESREAKKFLVEMLWIFHKGLLFSREHFGNVDTNEI